ncbi:MAG: DNA-directed RNA polymerase subunit beta [candidate division Zixibacteria bacterium SM1_73]|nr:MAG: DNA-directed RNA polymerase subunit beta [candidate division Zixibacteria bacterium SM1_73]
MKLTEVKKIKRISFSKLKSAVELPNLLEIQLQSFREFLQPDVDPEKREDKGLQAVFKTIFPISDVRENHSLEFVKYMLGTPRYSIRECRDRNMTYSAPLKATLRLVVRETSGKSKNVKDIIEQDVFLGELPLITQKGTFIVNGAERVVVSQLHRSPGVFFDEEIHPNGKRLYSARIIPYRGSWVEFNIDVNDIIYAHIDSRRKIPVTTLLRALGYSTTQEILALFYEIEKVGLSGRKQAELAGRISAETVVDKQTGEVIISAGENLTDSHLDRLKELKIGNLRLIVFDSQKDTGVIINTLQKDPTSSEEEAHLRIYSLLRPGDPPSLEMAQGLLTRLFFTEKRYNLGEVGRYMINQRLSLDVPLNVTVLEKKDFLAIIKYLIGLRNGEGYVDDIDHLGNRRVRRGGELLANQFSIGLSRMARTIRERMSLKDSETITPHDLVNARTVSAVIETFFGSSQLSQFMDQTNPLSELTHKRRLSALGPGGLTRERAGFEVRDVHHTHYGRMCPIETPEGPNIGLIASLSTYGRINKHGFLETPYRKVKNGKVTQEIHYLSADQEDKYIIAQANEPLHKDGRFVNSMVKARHRGDFPTVPPQNIDYMDVSPKQLVSVAAALIPFLEHDDANRALMGSNMQRQAVPLLITEPPLIGTGMEKKAALDCGALIVAQKGGVVESVTADKIVIKPADHKEVMDLLELDEYELLKFNRSNQDTCMNQRPLVKVGQRVEKGECIADGPATYGGELALGANVLVAFMPWRGYNFEDAIIVSEKLMGGDRFSSIHIEEFELQVRETKRGAEEITREIPNVSEEALVHLDERGVVRIGAEVEAGDILVGKVTPKGETELSPEERLLRAIFGEKAGDVRDASLKAPPGMKGIVIDTKVFSRKEQGEEVKKSERSESLKLKRSFQKQLEGLKKLRDDKLSKFLNGQVAKTIRSAKDNSIVFRAGFKFKEDSLQNIEIDDLVAEDGFIQNKKVNKKVETLLSKYQELISQKKAELEVELEKVVRGTELPPGVVQLVKVSVATQRKLSVGDKMAGRHGNKGVVAKIVPVEDMPYLPDGTPVDMILNPLGVPSRMNVGQILETHLGWAAKKKGYFVESPVFDGAKLEEVKQALKQADLPKSGKITLYDGKTGEPFDQPITVGYIYMMKLSHLVDDKIHARSIGPYSLVTQQPLGGKAQFGGQRFGEMEVWALEAYGAAYSLQEMLTVKSDDVMGRSRVYESIVKGENPPEPGIPESFNVLVKELQSLGLDVELIES